MAPGIGDGPIFHTEHADEGDRRRRERRTRKEPGAHLNQATLGTREAAPDALSDTQDAQIATCRSVAHPRADALGDGIEQRLAHLVVEPPVHRQ
ncbi:hypothetical protein ACFYM2_14965 [Streptomyces sp. NPDC006711]|uniref:hypothetical protein n=1 Tax=Streptomyces sp. NPDC006711 TaxID=3364762 RepID=UPI0036924CCC